ncbi:UDP-N-acetylglucosamine 2-epimerase [Alphaproteobacteria bacterium]|nr:UDP-N-acetylglucosamine 2-epimerase [Alphaproteobacteria bacterium]
MKKLLKISVFSGNRAEYGLLFPIIKKLKNDKAIKMDLIISGSHLEKNFGNTKKEIINDGFDNFQEVKIKKLTENNSKTPLSISSCIEGIVPLLKKNDPDLFIVYADRFEGFAALIAASQMNIPSIHFEGGDKTEGGALDDSVRHAMTKLAHFHITTNDEAKNRILNLGEEKWRVKNFGFPMIDLIDQKIFATKKELQKKFHLNSKSPIIIFTQHSVTTEFQKANEQITPSLEALETLAKRNFQIIVTFPNNDIGGEIIRKKLVKYSNIYENFKVYSSIGRYNYHGILSLSKIKDFKVICIGNSSSGLKETPAFNCPTINIGSRQKNRLRGLNVIDVGYSKSSILKAVNKALFDKVFIKNCNKNINPYGKGNVAIKFIKFLKDTNFANKEKILKKKITI